MAQDVKNAQPSHGLANASLILGIIACLTELLPLLSEWFIFIGLISWPLILIGIICGIIGLTKGQGTKAVIGIILAVVAIVLPWILGAIWADAAIDATSSLLELTSQF